MKSLTIRLPAALAERIEREAAACHVSKSDVLRECLDQPALPPVETSGMPEILEECWRAPNAAKGMRELSGDLIGSVRDDGLPTDLSSNKKKYLPALIRAKKRHRRQQRLGRFGAA